MKARFARYALIFITILVTAITLPDFYWTLFQPNIKFPKVYYSSVLKDFLFMNFDNQSNLLGYTITDSNGKKYAREEFEQKLPLFFYRQLTLNGTMPDTVDGVPILLDQVKRSNVSIRLRPRYLDRPQIQLFPLFESASGRVNLELPPDYFRITEHGIEFINASTNKRVEEKSARFTDALKKAGFVFPAKSINGNPTTRKAFDEGYFIQDQNNFLFHLKQVKGKPFVKKISLPDTVNMKYLKISENSLNEFYGVLIDTHHHVYLLSTNNYQLIPLKIKNYDANESVLTIYTNLLYRICSVRNPSQLSVFVFDKNYQLVREYHSPAKDIFDYPAGKILQFLAPFQLSYTDYSSSYIFFRFHLFKPYWVIFNLLLTLFTFVLIKRKNHLVKRHWQDLFIVATTGLYGLIGVWLFAFPGKHCNE